MSMQVHSTRTSNGSVLCLFALLACTGVIAAQPAPGGLGAGDVGGFPPMSAIPPLLANAPQPSPDPRNLEGVWYRDKPADFQVSMDMFGDQVPLNAAGQKVLERRVKSFKDGRPFINASAYCIPIGQPLQMSPSPFHIFQSQDMFDIQFQDYHGFYEIVMDPAKAPPPGYMGRSIGHWDGDTLVVETMGFKDALWLDFTGTPASKNARLTQRLRKVKSDHWYLEVQYTLDDPVYYTRPWSWFRDYSWRPDMTLFQEYNCEFQTGAANGLDLSLVPEPQD